MNRNTGSLPTPTIIITLVVFVLYIKSRHDCKTCNCHTWAASIPTLILTD